MQLVSSSHLLQTEGGGGGERERRESVHGLLWHLTEDRLDVKSTAESNPSQLLQHIFQALFLRIENSKLNLSVIINSPLCQRILSMYLYLEYKQLKMFTRNRNGSHVSNTMGGKE